MKTTKVELSLGLQEDLGLPKVVEAELFHIRKTPSGQVIADCEEDDLTAHRVRMLSGERWIVDRVKGIF